MPEVMIRDTKFYERVRSLFVMQDTFALDAKDIRGAAKYTATKLIGSGQDYIVTPHPTNKELVIAYYYAGYLHPKKVKWLYYVHNMMADLFSHNIPRFYGVIGAIRTCEKANLTGNIRQRIRGTNEMLFPFSDVADFIADARMPFTFEPHEGNFKIGIDGGEYFLDSFEETGTTWRPERINTTIDAMESWREEEKLEKKRSVERTISRLMALGLAEIQSGL